MNPEELAHLAAMGLPAPTNVTPSMRQGIRDRADSLWGPTLNVSPEAYARRRDQSRRLQLARDQGHGPKRRKLLSDYEYRMSLAVNDVDNIGLRASARKHSIKISTLKDRCAGAYDITTAHRRELSLTPEQEDDLVNYIIEREKAFQPLSRSEIRGFAQQLSEVNGQLSYIGKNWKPTKVFESARKRAVTRKSLSNYYEGLQWVINNKNITRANTYNVDENGMQLGETRAGIVAGTVMTARSEVIKTDNSTWASVIECISAGSRRLTPVVWFPNVFPNWKYEASLSGWSNTDIFNRWFMDIFIRETTPSDPSQWRLLVLDQHKSYITPELMKKAWMHRIWLSWLPSHLSHITQPLDVAVFGPLKTYYHQLTRAWATYEVTSPHQQQLFIEAYKRASEKAISRRNIMSGFSASGVFPVDVRKAIEALKPKERKRKTFEAPTTPKRPQVTDDMTWSTPQGSADIQKQQKAAQSEGIISIRDFNCIMTKMMKSIDNKNSQIQRLEEEKAILKALAAAKEPTGRVPVEFDPNAAFPSIDQIITARDQAEKNVIYKLKENAKEKRKKQSEKKTEDTIYIS
ncbi:hypothetical protein FGSG_13431 [Fusarium graminearum PH-1]|uniref:Chromosome 2, complete genome n=1 Tax=Gibberella zeae (strain ATCC MYA-4620 / CBS 123657 / FGSC 9075 / NRRL 31084 / PH-1) TaxID=229533 RepID=I1S9A1_GIBZE|nr:hypothetical protein FGSG_13431 [Fusarium graminearum PH-1]ESU15226.1 hypothetical protein FGSG_13431 [Fusarium graminearum PH-1]CEF76432.1 unnamed protein product [Fusarium graminearum]|eukprot:XP_011320651.1 hypothetical protein FGSG_13431 [Fusarium graminearum PH-1]